MMTTSILAAQTNHRNYQILEPFLSLESADGIWTAITTGDSTQTVNDQGGIKLLATTSNEYSGVRSTTKLFDFPTNTTGADYNEFGLNFAVRNDRDGTGTTSGWMVGVIDTTTTTIADTTGLLVSSASGFGFVLEKSTTVLKIFYASAGTPTKVELSAGTAGVTAAAVRVAAAAIVETTGTIGHVLSIQVKQVGSTTVEVKWLIDNVVVYHLESLDVTSFAAAYIEAIIKATSSTDEILYVDAITGYVHRGATTLAL